MFCMKIQLRLHNLNFYAFHGVLPHETSIGNQFIVNIELTADMTQACKTDQLEDTINYALVYDVVEREMMITSQLIENVAYRIYSKIKEEFPLITALEVRLKKLNPPIKGDVESSEVIISD